MNRTPNAIPSLSIQWQILYARMTTIAKMREYVEGQEMENVIANLTTISNLIVQVS